MNDNAAHRKVQWYRKSAEKIDLRLKKGLDLREITGPSGWTGGCTHAVARWRAREEPRIDVTVGGEATRGSTLYIIGQLRRVTMRPPAGYASLVNIPQRAAPATNAGRRPQL